MTQVARLLGSPLPTVYEDASVTNVQRGVLVGGVIDTEVLNKTVRDAGARVDSDVVAPLSQWLALHDTLVSKNKELESLRLEVDSRRRTVADLTVKEAAQRARLQRNADAKHEQRLDEVVRTLQHKTDKLNSATTEYDKFEEELHTRLVGLIRDAAYVKVHLGAALGTLGAALAQASKQIEAGPIPEVPVAAGPSLSGNVKAMEGHAAAAAQYGGHASGLNTPRSGAQTPVSGGARVDPSNPFSLPQQPGTPSNQGYGAMHRSTVSSAI